MENESLNNWKAAFSLSDTARQRVLCTSRLRHRAPSIAHQEANAPLLPPHPNMSNTTNSQLASPPSSCKRTHNLLRPDDTAVATPSLKKQPNRRIPNPSSKANQRPSQASNDNVQRDVPCSVKPSLAKKKLLKRVPPSTISSSEDEDNVHLDACRTASISTHAMSLSSNQSLHKMSKETIVQTVLGFDEKTAIRLEAEFFQCDALELAPKLLGKFLRRDEVVLQITEVEAYRPNDSACHGRFGVTPRTAPVFGPGGHAYVYLCYGLHIMLNVVADVEGIGAAVLIRSCAPVAGMQTIEMRRGISTNKPILLTGPGKVGQALGLTTEWSNHPLYTAGGLEVLDGPAPEKILVGPRVGIDYANSEDVVALWRFAISGTPWISAPRNTLTPLESSD